MGLLGAAVDAHHAAIEAENIELRKRVENLCERIAGQSELLSKKAEKPLDIFNEACRDLPEGWAIRVDLEEGSGTVTLEDPEGEEHYIVGSAEADTLEDTIRCAIKQARGG